MEECRKALELRGRRREAASLDLRQRGLRNARDRRDLVLREPAVDAFKLEQKHKNHPSSRKEVISVRRGIWGARFYGVTLIF